MRGPVLVTGAGGQLGTFIVRAFADCGVLPMTRAAFDITDPEAVREVVADAAPAVIINCAAFNDVDAAQEAPTEALAANAFAVRSLARAAEAAGATLVHYSTDFVFDGTAAAPYDESSPPQPRSTYSVSKLLGEWFALDAPGAFVLRVESLFGCSDEWRGRRGTLDKIAERLRSGEEQVVFIDRVVSPSYLPDVAAATRHLVEVAHPGLYHVVNGGQATWFEVATETARALGVVPRLRPITMDQVATRAMRPQYCALSNRKLASTGFPMPTWQDALRRWLGTPEHSAT